MWSVWIGENPTGTRKGASFPLGECIVLESALREHEFAAHKLNALIAFRSTKHFSLQLMTTAPKETEPAVGLTHWIGRTA